MKRFPITILTSLLVLALGGFGATSASAQQPKGQCVTIRANFLSEVVEVESSGDLIANQLSWNGSTDEEFIKVSNPDGTVSFYSVSAQKYVSAHSMTAQLVADSTTIGSQQKFGIQASQYTGWAPAGDDEVTYFVGIGTDWSINSATDGSIYSPSLDAAGEWQNMSVMPIPILPGSFSPNYPQSGVDVSEGLGAQNAGVVFENTHGASGDYLKILSPFGRGDKWSVTLRLPQKEAQQIRTAEVNGS